MPWADQSLSGVVVDPRGQGIGGVQVGYERRPTARQNQSATGLPLVRQTDAQGRFRVTGLPRGAITLALRRPDEVA